MTSKRIASRMKFKEQRLERSEVQKRVFISYTSGDGQTVPDTFETCFHTVYRVVI